MNPQTERKHKIIYFKEDLDFIVGAGGREDFNIELEGEGEIVGWLQPLVFFRYVIYFIFRRFF